MAGLILLNFAPEPQTSWENYDHAAALGLDTVNDYKHTFFPNLGEVSKVGLTAPGESLLFGEAEIWTQDQSIMSWTAGFTIASARDVAKFYWDLLGPERKLVSEENLKKQIEFAPFDLGFGSKNIRYGGGLMLLDANMTDWRLVPTMDALTASIGHEGRTYGYGSENAFFPNMNFSMSLISDNDFDLYYPKTA